jgi:hypothetical protein
MAVKRLVFLLAAGLITLTALPASALLPEEQSSVFEIPITEPAILQAPLDFTAATQTSSNLSTRVGGHWNVHLWHPDSNTPMFVHGTGVQLTSGPIADDAMVAVAKRFITENQDLFRATADDLELERVVHGAGKVAVHFQQRFHGVPVIGGRVKLLFTEGGRLYVFGSTFFSEINVSPVPAIGATQASGIAQQDLPFNPATDRVLDEPSLLVFAKHREGTSPEYHLVWRMTVATSEPYGAWVSFVDAHDGKIVARESDIHSLYSGTSQGDVWNDSYCDPNQTLPFRDMNVTITGIGTALTNATGGFSVGGTGGPRALSAQLDGPNVNVNDQQFPPDANYTDTIQENVPLTLNWTNVSSGTSNEAERMAFYWINETKAFVKGIDPVWNMNKVTANVNVNATCNANFNSGSWTMNLFRAGGGCANTGHIGDVIAHELGHGIQTTLLGFQGNEGLGEGNADITATFMVNDSVIGRGFNLNICTAGIRDCENTLVYPGDVAGQGVHNAGRVICGFNWDARQLLEVKMGQAAGEAHTAHLWHFARKLWVPDLQPEQVAAYFVIDDNDGNTGNGTPNYDEICEAAENHTFACATITEGVNITHTELTDTLLLGPFAVPATIAAFGPHPLDNSTCKLHYSLNAGAYTEVLMTPTGGSNFEGTIPVVAGGTAIAYYITAATTAGATASYPEDAPEQYVLFGAGPFTTDLTDDIETNQGWSVGETGTDGTWIRADPNGTNAGGVPVNPEDDHTPNPGVICWVTGNPPPGSFFFQNEVDGTTSVQSPNLDMTGATLVRGTVYLWAYIAVPADDFLDIQASTDGGTNWATVRRINSIGLNSWNAYDFTLSPFDFTFGNQVRIRFRASDGGTDTIVDCGMDDFVIRSLRTTTQAVEQPTGAVPVSYALLPSQPNPFNPSTEIRYLLPKGEKVKLTVFDVTGRELKTLVDEDVPAGSHAVSWDGKDDDGRAQASGVYFYRLEAGQYTQTHRMTLLK